ncbi:hypothetical protein LT337_32215 (plasmid) [Mycolicibacterium fortuitum]|nr:hypothetical protein LT337_32215 [Mycolicibacterium fortuitum]
MSVADATLTNIYPRRRTAMNTDGAEWTMFTIPRAVRLVKWLIYAAGNALAAYSAITAAGWLAVPLVIVFAAFAIACLGSGWAEWTEQRPELGPTIESLP